MPLVLSAQDQADAAAVAEQFPLVWELAKTNQSLTVSQILGLWDNLMSSASAASRTTIWRGLSAARSKGLLLTEGEGRGAKWRAADRLVELSQRAGLAAHFAVPLHKRSMVAYNPDFLADYQPNDTHYLTRSQRQTLRGLCEPGSAEFGRLDRHDRTLFLCGLPYASSALEGNRYKLADTIKLLEDGLAMEGATARETTMVLNHRKAINFVLEGVAFPPRPGDVSFSPRDIKQIHALLSSGLMDDPADIGAVRRRPVLIANSSYLPAQLPQMLESQMRDICDKAAAIADPWEQSFFLTVHLSYLQAFSDCNKRTARLVCNIPLLRSGVVPMTWMNTNREAYSEGVVGVFEANNFSLLREVFLETFVRSAESFHILCKDENSTSALRRQYRPQIDAWIKSRLADEQEPGFEASAEHGDLPLQMARAELADLVENPLNADAGYLSRLGVSVEEVIAWGRKERESADGDGAEDEAPRLVERESG